MTTLAGIKAELADCAEWDNSETALWAGQWAELLIRAVEQLRAVYSFDGWRSLAEIDRLDPDVLELLDD